MEPATFGYCLFCVATLEVQVYWLYGLICSGLLLRSFSAHSRSRYMGPRYGWVTALELMLIWLFPHVGGPFLGCPCDRSLNYYFGVYIKAPHYISYIFS